MPGVTDLGVFIVAGLLLNITPGVDLLFITSRSVVQGRRAGIVAALGTGTGCLVHVTAAALGLSVLLLSSSLAFTVVKYLGAAYLIYLGLSSLLRVSREKVNPSSCPASYLPPAKIFRQAILINVLNPKIALFFMALLPQFVVPGSDSPSLAFLFLGLVFTVNGTLVNILFAFFSSTVALRMKANAKVSRLLKRMSAALFVALGLRLAVS